MAKHTAAKKSKISNLQSLSSNQQVEIARNWEHSDECRELREKQRILKLKLEITQVGSFSQLDRPRMIIE